MVEYNRKIFDSIDSEEKAYWLGFIVADGYLNEDRNMLRIKLGNRDKEHLIKFINFVSGVEDMLKEEIHGITGNSVYYVSLYSSEIKTSLKKLKVEQGKSGKEQVPDIEEKYHRAFLKGVWDGDGFIRENLTGVGLVGSEELLTFAQQHLFKYAGVKPLKLHPHGKIFKIEYRSTKDAIPKILNYLYNNKDTFYLTRKKELSEKI